MAKYANVIVDISHEKLDKTFQYRIPEALEREITEGVQVEIPFGSRRIKGYVIELTDTPQYDISKMKEIFSVAQGSVAIEAQLIALAAWIRSSYGGTMNQALKTVLPIKQKTAVRQKQTLVLLLGQEEAGALLAEFTRKHSTARARLLEALIEQRELPKEVATQKLHISNPVIKAFAENEIIAVKSETAYRNPVRNCTDKGYDKQLNTEQQAAVKAVLDNQKKGIQKTYLLKGVTGSGKTEVYMELIAHTVAQGKQAIVLIPEIALTYQTVMRFYNRFGDRVSILNSRLSAGERYDQFLRAKNGEIDIMIGPRSALFTPFLNLGLIIIDEEHETTYKSESVPRYHARETAIVRAKMAGASVVLGSATPSVESYYRAQSGQYELLELKHRISGRKMPECEVIDLREELKKGNRSILSIRLQELMEERLAKRQQTILFLNRRGVSGFISCRSCGHVLKCPHCDVSLSWHNNGKMVCHYCGYEEPAAKVCPSCGSKYIGGFKAGTQKIEMLVRERFPQARILRMDFDTTRGKDGHEQILSAFANQEADILIGTQMIVKGHDFPNVTLVGILAADMSLNASDYHGAERTFQLLTQAAGRAGRGTEEGNVIIQTYKPEHYSIQTAKEQNYESFYEREIEYRSMLYYPPVWNMLVILCGSPDAAAVAQTAELLAEEIKRFWAGQAERLQVIGPADASVAKVNDSYKKVIYLKTKDYSNLVRIKDRLENYMKNNRSFRETGVQFDFNPVSGF